jgi:hypothetical protein
VGAKEGEVVQGTYMTSIVIAALQVLRYSARLTAGTCVGDTGASVVSGRGGSRYKASSGLASRT